MSAIYYLMLLAPFVVLFAFGYFPVALLGRLIAKRRLCTVADAYAPFAGALGTAIAFIFFGLLGLDRFAFVSEHVRTVWQSSGWVYEMGQGVFGGVLCALLLAAFGAFVPRWSAKTNAVTPVTAVLVSFITFCVWPVLCSPFV